MLSLSPGSRAWTYQSADPRNYLGKFENFTHLIFLAIEGDDSPNPNHHLWVSVENSEVVMKLTQIHATRSRLRSGTPSLHRDVLVGGWIQDHGGLLPHDAHIGAAPVQASCVVYNAGNAIPTYT